MERIGSILRPIRKVCVPSVMSLLGRLVITLVLITPSAITIGCTLLVVGAVRVPSSVLVIVGCLLVVPGVFLILVLLRLGVASLIVSGRIPRACLILSNSVIVLSTPPVAISLDNATWTLALNFGGLFLAIMLSRLSRISLYH